MNAKSWKTTSMGITLIVSSITGFIFALKNNHLDETTISASITGFLGGIGLIVSKDYNVSGNPAINIDEPDAPKTVTQP